MHRTTRAILLCLALAAGLAAVDDKVTAALGAAMRRQDWAAVEDLCRKEMATDTTTLELPYLLARALARQGRTTEALTALTTAVELGFADPVHGMRADSDLISLRKEPAFAALCAKVHAKALAEPYERGADIAGVTTHEGWPQDGLRYRLRLPAGATAAKPARLVVWLHPSGSSANAQAESMTGEFAKRNLALVVFTKKDFRVWDPADGKRIIEVELPALAAIPGVDSTRPFLLGFSAGGQMALAMWKEEPGRFGGLMLCAAYPVEPKPGFPPMALPTPTTLVKGSHIFALVGSKDAGGVRTWRGVEAAWKTAGIDLTWRQVEGRGHEYLFTGGEQTAMFAWLDALFAPPAP